jgi:hypothetical protein
MLKMGLKPACRTFHGGMSDPQVFEPLAQPKQVWSHGTKRSPLLVPLA